MKVIHVSINQAQKIIEGIHDNNLENGAVKDLIHEIEQATGFRFDPVTRCWISGIRQ